MAELIDVHRILHLVIEDTEALFARLRARALIQGRKDDADDDVIRRRYETYENETRATLSAYRNEKIADQAWKFMGPMPCRPRMSMDARPWQLVAKSKFRATSRGSQAAISSSVGPVVPVVGIAEDCHGVAIVGDCLPATAVFPTAAAAAGAA